MFHKKKKKSNISPASFSYSRQFCCFTHKNPCVGRNTFFFFFFKINVKSVIFNEAQFKIHTKYSFFFNPNQIQEPRFPIYSQYTSKVVTMMLFFFPPQKLNKELPQTDCTCDFSNSSS